MHETPPRRKVFADVTRITDSASELLVLESHDEPRFKAPKGETEAGETPERAVERELLAAHGTAVRLRRTRRLDRI